MKEEDTFLVPNRKILKSCKIAITSNFGMRFSASRRRKLWEYNEVGFIAVKLWEMVQNGRNKRLKYTKRACRIYTLPRRSLTPKVFKVGISKGGATTAISVVESSL